MHPKQIALQETWLAPDFHRACTTSWFCFPCHLFQVQLKQIRLGLNQTLHQNVSLHHRPLRHPIHCARSTSDWAHLHAQAPKPARWMVGHHLHHRASSYVGALAARSDSSCSTSARRGTEGACAMDASSPSRLNNRSRLATHCLGGSGASACPPSSLCPWHWRTLCQLIQCSRIKNESTTCRWRIRSCFIWGPCISSLICENHGSWNSLRVLELISLLPRLARLKHHGSALTSPSSLRPHCFGKHLTGLVQTTCSPKAITWTLLLFDFVSHTPLRQLGAPFLVVSTNPRTTSPKAQIRPL